MERWMPLFNIFLNSPSPEGEASLWIQQQQQQSQRPPLSTFSFLSLLLKPLSTNTPKIWMQTLPNPIQSRILSFLSIESRRFSVQQLHSLATHILNSHPQHHPPLDFWVEKAARHLLDTISSRNSTPIHSFGSSSVKDGEFSALPDWLRNHTTASSVFPWLPLSPQMLENKVEENAFLGDDVSRASMIEIDDDAQEEVGSNESAAIAIAPECIPTPDPEVHARAAALKSQLLSSNSASETISVANGIIQLCSDASKVDPFAILGVVEPWEANDEIISVLVSHLLGGREDSPMWSIQVLSSVILPQLLVLQHPASRLLVTTMIDCCKLHQKAVVDAILIPLVLRKEGINTPLCDLITRIVKECLRPAHVSAFCQKLLCREEVARRSVCLPCHQCLVSDKLVWTEPLFALFQNFLNLNVYLTPDSVYCIFSYLDEMADRFPKSLKFGSFFLCFVGKCAPLLKVHRVSLRKTAEKTDTFMTRSILSKLDTW